MGKGAALHPVLSLIKEANTSNVLSDRLTIEYILERLSKGFPSQVQVTSGMIQVGVDHSAMIFAPELSVLLRSSSDALGTLSDLWDSTEHPFDYGTRTKGLVTVDKPCVSFLGASAPGWLVKSIPRDAVGGGFTRRVNFIYAKGEPPKQPWPVNHTGGRDKLVQDLRHISSHIHGEYKLDNAARPLFEKYHNDSVTSDFDDEASAVYKTSRWAQALKLAMAIASSKRDVLAITKEDFTEACTKVDAVVSDIPIVFRAVGESDLVVAADKILRFMERHGMPVTAEQIMRSAWRDVGSSDNLYIILSTLRQGGLITEVTQGTRTLYMIVVTQQAKGATP